MIRYVDGPADSARWQDFPLRPDDIVISTPSKCGTTWLQMICALLIFQTVDLPAPLTTLSPWLDMRLRPLPEVRAALAAQRHRRFIKTHTPLDGLPRADGVSYIVVGRDPRDVAISMAHHRDNLDAELIHRLLGAAPPGPPDQDTRSGVRRWVEKPDGLASLAGMVRHLAGAWDRRAEPAIIMLHYGQLVRDLDGTMRQLANRLGIDVPEWLWPELVGAASFDRMRERAAELVPDERIGLIKDSTRFFRAGTTGQWRTVFTAADLRRYEERVAELAAGELIAWLHGG